jgi:hypothetical protein
MAIGALYIQAMPMDALEKAITPEVLVAMFIFSFMTQILFVWASFSTMMRFFIKKMHGKTKRKTSKSTSDMLMAEIPVKTKKTTKAKLAAKPKAKAKPKRKKVKSKKESLKKPVEKAQE